MVQYETNFSSTLRHTIYYRYICEFCGQSSGWLPKDMMGSSSFKLNGNADMVTIKQQHMLDDAARENLLENIDSFHKEIFKGTYPIEGHCPHCNKQQSWFIDHKKLKREFWKLVICFFAAGLLLSIIYWLLRGSFLWLVMIPVLSLCVGIGIGFYRYKSHAAKSCAGEDINSGHNRPEFNFNGI